jgi:hypothetical protein
MRKVFTVAGVITAVAALCGIGAAASAGLAGAHSSTRPADRLEVADVVPTRVLVADRGAADLSVEVAGTVTLDASLGAALVVSAPLPAPAAPAVLAAAEPAAPAASGGTRITCAGADGIFRPVAAAADCPGDSALRIERV